MLSLLGARSPNTTEKLVARYAAAMADPDAPPLHRYETIGTLSGAGMTGTFHIWKDGDRRRVDQQLGLHAERSIRMGDRRFIMDSSGNVRELHGRLLRHERTEDLIDSGELASVRDCCRFVGSTLVDGREAYELIVTAPGGEPESLYLDAETALPLRVGYDSDDGRETMDFFDWRTIRGHRFAFRSLSSDGNKAFDLTEATKMISVETPIEASVFDVPPNHVIEAPTPQHLHLVLDEDHLLVPVAIHGRRYTFLLDSGSQSVILDESVAREIGLQEEGMLEASGARRIGGLRMARLDALGIGTATLPDLVVAVLDLGASTNGAFRIDGILGYPFFASAEVRLDAAGASMEFGLPGSLAASGERLEADVDRSLVEVPALINGVSAPFMMDTGDASNLLLYRPFIDRHPNLVPMTFAGERSYGLGGATYAYHSVVHRFTLGGISLRNVPTEVMLAKEGAFADRFDAGNIGLGMLRDFVVTFDLANNTLYLQRSETERSR